MRSWRRTAAGLSLAACLALGAPGCATTGSTGGESGSSDVITRDEIVETDVSNLYQVVQRLRPGWLQIQSRSMERESEILVIRDGTVIGDVQTLRELGRDGIQQLRWMDGETAAATLVGARSGYVEGAIVVERGSGS